MNNKSKAGITVALAAICFTSVIMVKQMSSEQPVAPTAAATVMKQDSVAIAPLYSKQFTIYLQNGESITWDSAETIYHPVIYKDSLLIVENGVMRIDSLKKLMGWTRLKRTLDTIKAVNKRDSL